MKTLKTCGKAIIELLEAYGIEMVFGIPGTHTLELYAGLHNSRIRHILTRTEQGAGFMADGYIRASGKIGVCFVVGGPGLLNAATAMASAYADSVPILVISSATPTPTFNKGWGESHEVTYQRNSTASYTAFSATAHRAEDIPDLMGRAFTVFDSARPRPVHIEIPTDLFAAEVVGNWRTYQTSLRPAPHPDAIAEAADLLDKAEKPAIYVGGGAIRAAEAIRGLAERLAAPVMTTTAGMGVFPASHPLSLGSTIPWEPARRLLEEADVLLAIGTEMASQDFWEPQINLQGKLIRVDIDPKKLADHYPAEVAIQGDAALASHALLKAITSTASGERHRLVEARVRDTLKEVRSSVTEKEAKQERVCLTIQTAIPEDALLFGDLTQLAYTAYRLMPMENPGQFFTSKGFGALGYALPAAIGAKLACPDRTVMALAGDSGFLYNVQEMATAHEEQVPITLILWNNTGLEEIRCGYIKRGIEPIAADMKAPDHLKLTEAFGWHAIKVDTHAALKDAVRHASTRSTSTLIEVMEGDPW